jgi:hypothetical protein
MGWGSASAYGGSVSMTKTDKLTKHVAAGLPGWDSELHPTTADPAQPGGSGGLLLHCCCKTLVTVTTI